MANQMIQKQIFTVHTLIEAIYRHCGFSERHGIVYGDRQTVNHILEINLMMRRGAYKGYGNTEKNSLI